MAQYLGMKLNFLLNKEIPGPECFTGGHYQTHKEETIPLLYKLFHLESQPNPDTKPDRDIIRKQQTKISHEIDAKNP